MQKKEKQYEEEEKRLREEKAKNDKKEVEEIIKDEILSDETVAKEILGEEGAQMLQEEFSKNKKKKDSIYMSIKKRQEKNKDAKFKKEHPELEGLSERKLHQEREENDMKRYINQAANQLYVRPTSQVG